MNSYKNTSSGSMPPKAMKIGENKAKVPPAGSSNSYEKALKSEMQKDDASMRKMPYSKAKMANK